MKTSVALRITMFGSGCCGFTLAFLARLLRNWTFRQLGPRFAQVPADELA
jgi:hypothetical protein